MFRHDPDQTSIILWFRIWLFSKYGSESPEKHGAIYPAKTSRNPQNLQHLQNRGFQIQSVTAAGSD